MVAAFGKLLRVAMRRKVWKNVFGVAAAFTVKTPFAVDFENGVGGQSPAGSGNRMLDRTARLEGGAGGVVPYLNPAEVLKADQPLRILRFQDGKTRAVRAGPDLRDSFIRVDDETHTGCGLSFGRVKGDLHGFVPCLQHYVFVVVRVNGHGNANLPEVIEAFDALAFFFGAGERGKEHAGQNSDDRNDDQKFNQGKGGSLSLHKGWKEECLNGEALSILFLSAGCWKDFVGLSPRCGLWLHCNFPTFAVGASDVLV